MTFNWRKVDGNLEFRIHWRGLKGKRIAGRDGKGSVEGRSNMKLDGKRVWKRVNRSQSEWKRRRGETQSEKIWFSFFHTCFWNGVSASKESHHTLPVTEGAHLALTSWRRPSWHLSHASFTMLQRRLVQTTAEGWSFDFFDWTRRQKDEESRRKDSRLQGQPPTHKHLPVPLSFIPFLCLTLSIWREEKVHYSTSETVQNTGRARDEH